MTDTSEEAQCADMPPNILRALSKRLSEHHRDYHTAPILEMSAGAMVRGADTIEALSAERDALRQQVKDLSAQPYVYIGKDGKSTLARDLEDERDALSARVVELEAEVASNTYTANEKLAIENQRISIENCGLRNSLEAALEAAQPEVVAEVKPLVWYGKPNTQKMRIGRCGQVAYSVQFKMGRWGYTRGGDTGHIYSFKGCRLFETEADAVNGADLDHAERVRQTITITPKADAIREGMERALELVTGFPEVKLSATIPCDPSEAITETCREVASAIRKAMEDVK